MRKRIAHRIENGIEQKYCKPCNTWCNLENFNKKRASSDNLETKCRDCAKKKSKKFRNENPSYDREYQVKNAERLKAYKRNYYQKKKVEAL